MNLTKESEKLQTRYDSSLARKVTTESGSEPIFLGRVWSLQISFTPFVDPMIDAEHRGGPCKIGLPFPSRYERDSNFIGLRRGWRHGPVGKLPVALTATFVNAVCLGKWEPAVTRFCRPNRHFFEWYAACISAEHAEERGSLLIFIGMAVAN